MGALLTTSGQMANLISLLNILGCGDHFISSAAIYGGTVNLFAVTMKNMGIDCTFIDNDATEDEIRAAFRPNTKAIFGEVIANPKLSVLDIEKYAKGRARDGRSPDCGQHVRNAGSLPAL